MENTTTTQKFEVGQTYYGRFICDYSSAVFVTIEKRTAKTVWFEVYGKMRSARVKTMKGYTKTDGTHQPDYEYFTANPTGVSIWAKHHENTYVDYPYPM